VSACHGPQGKWRTIREEPLFRQQLAKIEPSARRSDEFLEGAREALSRNPSTCGRPTAPWSAVWRMVTNDAAPITPLVLYYAFDANDVYLLSIEVGDANAQE